MNRSSNRFVRRDCSRSAAGVAGELGHVEPGLERLALARVDDDTHLRIGVELAPGPLELLHHPRVHRVRRHRAGRTRASRPDPGARPGASRNPVADFGLGHAHGAFVVWQVVGMTDDQAALRRYRDSSPGPPFRSPTDEALVDERRTAHVRAARRRRSTRPLARWSRAASSPATGSRSGRRTARSGSSPRSASSRAGGVLVPLEHALQGRRGALRARAGRREDALHRHRLPRHELRGAACAPSRTLPELREIIDLRGPAWTEFLAATAATRPSPTRSPATTSARSCSRRARPAGPRARC